jgi:hypothetical protein
MRGGGFFTPYADYPTSLGQMLTEFDGRAVLDRRGDNVTLVGIQCRRRADGGVDRFGAAARKQKLGLPRADKRSQARLRLVQCGGCGASQGIGTRRISIPVTKPRDHGIDNLRRELRRGVVVEVDRHGELFRLTVVPRLGNLGVCAKGRLACSIQGIHAIDDEKISRQAWDLRHFGGSDTESGSDQP